MSITLCYYLNALTRDLYQVEYLDGTEEEIAARVKAYNTEGQDWLKNNRRRPRPYNNYRGGYNNNNYNNKMYNNYRDNRLAKCFNANN